jgi:putative membrane protein
MNSPRNIEYRKFFKVPEYETPLAEAIQPYLSPEDRVGISSENPFEGGSNIIPMAALSRTIEIDLREMLGETELPEPLEPVGKILL